MLGTEGKEWALPLPPSLRHFHTKVARHVAHHLEMNLWKHEIFHTQVAWHIAFVMCNLHATPRID